MLLFLFRTCVYCVLCYGRYANDNYLADVKSDYSFRTFKYKCDNIRIKLVSVQNELNFQVFFFSFKLKLPVITSQKCMYLTILQCVIIVKTLVADGILSKFHLDK